MFNVTAADENSAPQADPGDGDAPHDGAAGQPVSTARFSRETGLAAQVADVIEPAIEDLGYQLVRVVISGRDGGTLQVMIDHAQRDVHIDDCVQVTREIDPLLDANHQGLRLSHRLEVSTPGIDRPLVRPADVLEFLGHEVKLELKSAFDNRKRFRGWLDDFAGDEIRLSTDLSDGNGLQVLGFHISAIDTLKLMLTDELIDEMQARRAQAMEEAEAEALAKNEALNLGEAESLNQTQDPNEPQALNTMGQDGPAAGTETDSARPKRARKRKN